MTDRDTTISLRLRIVIDFFFLVVQNKIRMSHYPTHANSFIENKSQEHLP